MAVCARWMPLLLAVERICLFVLFNDLIDRAYEQNDKADSDDDALAYDVVVISCNLQTGNNQSYNTYYGCCRRTVV